MKVDEYLLVGPRFKSVVVVGRPGTYGWSRRLQEAANCIVARWEGGDQISDWELGWHLGQFVRAGKITENQRIEFYEAIRRLDEDKGGVEDLQSMRAFAKILGMRVIAKASEPPLPYVEPGPHSMSYWEAYGLAHYIRLHAPEVDVRVVKSAEEGHFPFGGNGPKSRPGAYFVKTGPRGTV